MRASTDVVIGKHRTLSSIYEKVRNRQLLMPFLLVCSLLLNVALAKRITTLNNSIVSRNNEGRLIPGKEVPPIQAFDLIGNRATISYNGTDLPTILYVFTPQCHWCKSNLANMRVLSNSVAREYRFIGLSLSAEQLKDYVQANSLDVPIYTQLYTDSLMAYKLSGTPQTIVISPNGKVVKVWTGAYTPEVKEEIEKFFRIHLPGMETESKGNS